MRTAVLPVALVVWAFVGGVSVVQAVQELNEAQVKAAFIYNFSKFTQWPASKTGPIVIGVAGRSEVNDVLKNLARGKAGSEREFVVRDILKDEPLGAFHIIFIPASEGSRVSALLGRTPGGTVLTVGDSEDFLTEGGIVRFYISGNRVRFQINAEAANRAGLKLSSQLLTLAK